MAIATAYGSGISNRYPTWPQNGLKVMFWDNNLGCYSGSGTSMKDLSGESNNGVLWNFSNPSTSSSGYYDKRLQFDGINDNILYPTSWLSGATAFSFYIIFKVKSVYNSYGQESFPLGLIGGGTSLRVHFYQPATPRFTTLLFLQGNLTSLSTYCYTGNITQVSFTDISRYYHFCVSVQPGDIRTYLNGQLNNVSTLNIGSLVSFPNRVGMYHPSLLNAFYGNIPLFMGYNKAISAQEASSIYSCFKSRYS